MKTNNKIKENNEINNSNTNYNIASIKIIFSIIIINLIYITVQLLGSYYCNSNTLLVECIHSGFDMFGYIISITTLYISGNKKLSKKFGNIKIDEIGALINIVIMYSCLLCLVYENILEIYNRELPFIIYTNDITKNDKDYTLVYLSILGLVFNLAKGMSIIFDNNTESQLENPNIKATLIHIISDSIQSIFVLLGSLIMYYYPQYEFIDYLCSLIFVFIVVMTTKDTFKDNINTVFYKESKKYNKEE